MSSVAVQHYPSIDDVIYEEKELPEEREEFIIDNQDKANWAAKRILHAQDKIAERKQLAKQYKQRIDSWLADANTPDEKTIESLSGLLSPYVEEELKHNGNRKSIALFGVTIGFRKQPEKVDIIDSESALSYCETHHPESVIVKKELSKTELKKLCGKGIFIPGILLDGGQDKLYVKGTDNGEG
jgi:phage host-nuclease inhibitor protein Gam